MENKFGGTDYTKNLKSIISNDFKYVNEGFNNLLPYLKYSKLLTSADKVILRDNEAIKREKLFDTLKLATGYAVTNNASFERIGGGLYSSPYYTSSPEGMFSISYNDNGRQSSCCINSDNKGYVPVVFLGFDEKNPEEISDLKSNVFERMEFDEKVHYISLGLYPQSPVEKDLEAKLEEEFSNLVKNNKSDLKSTGLTYTEPLVCDSDNYEFCSRNAPCFQYGKDYFVRTHVNNFTLSDMKINDKREFTTDCYNEAIHTDDVVWIKVEPINFKICNWDTLDKNFNHHTSKKHSGDKVLELESEKVLMAGLPFYALSSDELGETSTICNWKNSTARAYLNSIDSKKDCIKAGQLRAYKTWDFENRGFLQEALNLKRQKVLDFTIPKGESLVPSFAFDGCLHLNSVTIPKSVKNIDPTAFNNCNFQYINLLENDTITISKAPVKNAIKSELIKDIASNIDDFDFSIILGDSLNRIEQLKKLNEKLKKSKCRLAAQFVKSLYVSGKLDDFIESGDLRAFAGEMNSGMNESLQKVLSTCRCKEERDDAIDGFYRFAYAIGCFSDKKLKLINGLDSQTPVSLKATGILSSMLKKGVFWEDHFKDFSSTIPVVCNENRITEMLKHIENIENLNYLLFINSARRGILGKFICNFDKAEKLRKDVDSLGKSVTVPWKDVYVKLHKGTKYKCNYDTHEDVAELFEYYGISERTLKESIKILDDARYSGVKSHILSKPLTEPTILEQIEDIKGNTSSLIADSKDRLHSLKQRESAYTYEFLDKHDPINLILGKVCGGGCATLDRTEYGRNICKATVKAEDVQNIVIRNASGDIVGKGAMYVNPKDGYAIINEFEICERMKKNETEIGYYLADKNLETERMEVLRAFIRAVRDFAKQFDSEHPDTPIKKVNVGWGYNRLKGECEKLHLKNEKNLLEVPMEYSFKDTEKEQKILYERNEESVASR